jgi:hypothetical protein
MGVSVGASAVAMPPPFSPLFVRLLFAISFFRARSQIRRAQGFGFQHPVNDLNDASQKESFVADRRATWVGLLSRCVISISNQPCRQVTIHGNAE